MANNWEQWIKENPGRVVSESESEPPPEADATDCIVAIGIDPGVSTGYVEWSTRDEKLLRVETCTFYEALGYMDAYPSGLAVVVIEDPSRNRFTYGRHNMKGAKRDRLNRNVGKNQREAELLVEGAERMGHEVKPVTPSGSKWDAEAAKRVLGYPLPSENEHPNNEHVRDALRLLHNAGYINRL